MFLMPVWQTEHFRAIVILFRQPSLSLCFTFYNIWKCLKSVTCPQHSSLLSLHCLWPERFSPSWYGKHCGPHLNPGPLGFFSRVATIHAGWDFGEPLCISEYVDFPHTEKLQLQRQAYTLAVCHQAFLSLWQICIYIYTCGE